MINPGRCLFFIYKKERCVATPLKVYPINTLSDKCLFLRRVSPFSYTLVIATCYGKGSAPFSAPIPTHSPDAFPLGFNPHTYACRRLIVCAPPRLLQKWGIPLTAHCCSGFSPRQLLRRFTRSSQRRLLNYFLSAFGAWNRKQKLIEIFQSLTRHYYLEDMATKEPGVHLAAS